MSGVMPGNVSLNGGSQEKSGSLDNGKNRKTKGHSPLEFSKVDRGGGGTT